MPSPSPTLLSDKVGPIQNFPYESALKECMDLDTKNGYWIFNEDEQKVMRIIIEPQWKKAAQSLYLGIRIVYFSNTNYIAMAMSTNQKHNIDTPESAYDRAMGVVGKR